MAMAAPRDVIVIGAGPGGAAAASRLSDRGVRDVLVLDRYGFPRDKPCGGGLTGHADEALRDVGLRLDVPHWAAHTATVRFGGFSRTVTMERPVHVIRREEFDASLVEQVRAKGVEVVEGEGVTRIEPDRDGVTVVTSRGRTLRAKAIIGADGAASIVRKHLFDNEKALPHRLFRTEVPMQGTTADAPSMIYDFSPMVAGLRGYLWLFPVPGNRLNVGVMHYPSSRKSGIELTSILRDGLLRYGVELPEKGTRGWPVWGYEPSRAASAPRLLLVGDALGIDALTGEGIAIAMEHAAIAADEIVDALANGNFAFRNYRRRVRRAVVGRELALDRWLARLLYRRGESWRHWLALVLYDPDVLEMYAARVSGSEVLADQKARLYGALVRHLWRWRGRHRSLTVAAGAELSPPAERLLSA